MNSGVMIPALGPAVNGAGTTTGTGRSGEVGKRQESATGAEFQKVLSGVAGQGSSVVEPLKFSQHASARLQSRKLALSPEQMRNLNEAVNKAAAKGLDETLVLTADAAFIVSAKNRTVVTAMDRAMLQGNVFTNIEGAVVI